MQNIKYLHVSYIVYAIIIFILYTSIIVGHKRIEPSDNTSHDIINLINQSNFSGSVLVSINDSIILFKSFGYRDPNRNVLNDTATIFPLASITKIFIKHLILNLINEGVLNLDDRLSMFRPEIFSATEISIEHLLYHMSGLPDIHNELSIYSKIQTLPDSTSPEHLIETISEQRYLHFSPGSRQQYSNSNYILLADIIEKTSGASLEEILRHEIFQPFKMHHSGLYGEHSILPFHAVGFYNENGTVKYMTDFNFLNFWGSGNAFSTVHDMYKYSCEIRKRLSPINYSKLVHHTGYFAGINTAYRTIPEIGLCCVVLGNNGDCNAQGIVNEILDVIFDDIKAISGSMDLYEGKYYGEYLGENRIIDITLSSDSHVLQMNNREMLHLKENVFCLPENGYAIVTFSPSNEKPYRMTLNDNGLLLHFDRISKSNFDNASNSISQ